MYIAFSMGCGVALWVNWPANHFTSTSGVIKALWCVSAWPAALAACAVVRHGIPSIAVAGAMLGLVASEVWALEHLNDPLAHVFKPPAQMLAVVLGVCLAHRFSPPARATE